MSVLVFDIETVGVDWDSLSQSEQNYLTKFAKSEEEAESEKLKLGLYPLTAKVISIALYNPDSKRGKVLVETFDGAPKETVTDTDGFEIFYGDELFILNEFWNTISKFTTYVTFNGRGFDCPFLMMRSMINKIKPLRNLLPNRFGQEHIDLLDSLTFYGATRKFNLDFYCRRLGITSPKSEDYSGDQVAKLYQEKRLPEIAEYNKRDTIATSELYHLYKEFLVVK